MVQEQQQAPAARVRPRPNFRALAVSKAQTLTPNLVRITFAGDELLGYAPNGPAEHIRIWFPDPGEPRPVMPEWTPNGPQVAPGRTLPASRVYTPRTWRPDALELDVDFVLHGDGTEDGPGARWARNAHEGSEVVLAGPGGPYRGVTDESQWYVLAADHAGLPAVACILETLPASATARVFVEVESAQEELRLESAAELEVTWVHGGSSSSQTGRALESALKGVDLPEGEGRIFVACEAGVMRDIRRHLLYERGLSKDVIHTHGYWKLGAAGHPDHDLGEEV